jgi:hypothetical protein
MSSFNAREFLDTGVHRHLLVAADNDTEIYDVVNITLVKNKYFYVYYNTTNFEHEDADSFFAAPTESVVQDLFGLAGPHVDDVEELFDWTTAMDGQPLAFGTNEHHLAVLHDILELALSTRS